MEGANADSDHSMTWEDFFGSTTDLTPTLIEIYDSLLDPSKKSKLNSNSCETAKDARNDPPVTIEPDVMTETLKEENVPEISRENSTEVSSAIIESEPVINKSSLYPLRTKNDIGGASEIKFKLTGDSPSREMQHKGIKDTKQIETTSFDTLSPNVKRMISIASETTAIKLQKKPTNSLRSGARLKSNIPLVGATSKISQSGVELLPSVEIYDQPLAAKNFVKSKSEDNEVIRTTATKVEFKLNDDSAIYDVPNNNRPTIYDTPNSNSKTAFESLSLPYIDQSIELSNSSTDREFDPKISPKEISPQKSESKKSSPEGTPSKIPKTNGISSLHRHIHKIESPSKQIVKTAPYPLAIGSMNNFKSAIPEKEVVRLNPPVVEVSRPLSMSSIASSSSTSSSGVQNKGGVNSAYLASIESLDDHSEADIASANGSNNFVNNAGLANARTSEERTSENTSQQQTTDETSEMSQLERVCAEIVQTENVYVEDLRQVVEGYLHVWRQEKTFSEDELSELFNNIEDIYIFNRSLCGELNTCRLDATCIARCFVNNTSGFTIYTSYCTGYPRTMEVLAKLASKEESARQFRERQAALCQPLPLASYLLKPVQRILKYHLLLQNVVKQCASRDTQYALLKMTGIAQHIDDMKRRHEHAVRVQEIQSLLYGWSGPDLTTYGELCAEGTFRVFGAKAMRHAFLFDKMLLVTKNREDGILAYKSHIMCNNMMLVESLSGAPLSFQVIPWDVPRAQLTLQARSARHKREWTLLLKRVILENYNAVIPSHARQLVMELGQNKTDDDILAEKSHNLISQASMRKQLSAPEYLEKRKLERERRKAYETGGRSRLKKSSRKLTLPMTKNETSQECDCAQVSEDKGTDYTCDNCYVDLCSDCEIELNKVKKEKTCQHEDSFNAERCPDCDKRLHYIDSGSIEQLDRRPSICKCSDFKSSQESFIKDSNNSLNKTRGYHSSDNIVSYIEKSKSKEELSVNDTNNYLVNIRSLPKSCLKCEQIKENIAVTDVAPSRKSRCNVNVRADTFRSKSKDDPYRSKLSKIGTWRRKSEPGLPQNTNKMSARKSNEHDDDRTDSRGGEKIEFECRNCGSNKISKKGKSFDVLSDPEIESKSKGSNINIEMKVYTTKNMPKKISKLKKNRNKSIKLDKTAKFYTDFPTDISTENILHISESNESLNIEKPNDTKSLQVPQALSKDEDIDEETYKKLIEKTDSFKKNELEKVKFLNKENVINEGTENEEKPNLIEDHNESEIIESCEESEQPLEHIISQLLLQNSEFQKLLKKQQLRNSSSRRHQRLLKSHSNPEPTNDVESNKLQLNKQMSEDLDKQSVIENPSQKNENDYSEDDHIYETLRVEPRIDEHLHQLNIKSKTIHHPIPITRPKRLPSPPNGLQVSLHNFRSNAIESDYVYLSFDKLNNIQDQEGIYDIPLKSPEKVKIKPESDYIVMKNQGPPKTPTEDVVYDSLIEVTRRRKDVPNTLPSDYLPMSPDHQSPNTPEIWLSRQKEHFNVSRDRKSGSLPRSFQVVLNGQEDTNLSSFICKPNSTNKTYLNRDGKVMSTDRPFTIASDQSELSYDDVENYMSEGDILKYNKSPTVKDANFEEVLTQSTLELEQEIDRCYKNSFEKIKVEDDKNQNILNSETNLNTSVMSSCEVLTTENMTPKIDEIIHPEHKIYKPTGNMLSLKNVLSRFRSRTPNKQSDENENNANDQSSPDSAKSDVKSPTNEKKSALNPKNYSKNLLQRFRNIIGDEHQDDNYNKMPNKKVQEDQNNTIKNKITVVITTTDNSPTTSTMVYTINSDALSRSVYGNTTLSESQNEKNNLEILSHSCDNITSNEDLRPKYEKSISLTTNRSSTGSSTPSRSSGSIHNLNKLPIYKQGSKHLGARIAQSDYADPITLSPEKNITNVSNILINKNSVRPDSLFSVASFVTSSSDSAYQEIQKTKETGSKSDAKEDLKNAKVDVKSDDYSEKTFAKLEQVTDEDVFRDSAVYSDQEENEATKLDVTDSPRTKTVKSENVIRNSSFRAQTILVTTNSVQKTMIKDLNSVNVVSEIKNQEAEKTIKPKIAPPVPVKPKVTHIPTAFANKRVNINKTVNKTVESSTSLDTNSKAFTRHASSRTIRKSDVTGFTNDNKTLDQTNNLKPQGNIQLKRLSFERASLDSATRRLKANSETKTIEPTNVTTKSVLERRMELEKLTKTQIVKPQTLKKPSHITRPKTTKVAPFERSISDINDKKDVKIVTDKPTASASIDSINIENKVEITTDSDLKGSWVKQVVNKFQ